MRDGESTGFFKVLTEDLAPGTLLRPYNGVCPSCRSEARPALAAGTEELRRRLLTTTGEQREHLVNGVVELVFEAVRQKARALPSRLRSTHVFRTIEAARRFGAEWRRTAVGIYLVEQDGDLRHDSFMEWVDDSKLDPREDLRQQLERMHGNAASYWKSEQPAPSRIDSYTESLLSPHVRVVRTVERF